MTKKNISSAEKDAIRSPAAFGAIKNAGTGFASGFADIGDTLLNAFINSGEGVKNAVFDTNSPSDIKHWNDERHAGLGLFNQDYADSPAFALGRLGGNLTATAPIGPLLGSGAKGITALEKLGNAIASNGMRIGQSTAEVAPFMARGSDLGTRILGGAINGGASTGMVSPENSGLGALLGAAFAPGVLAANRLGNSFSSSAQPIFDLVQKKLAGRSIKDFIGNNGNFLGYIK
tara:strand:- start:12143 stop:12838 length:696 start_codon:yes stop_codon:yes gene_type:complete